MLIALLVVLLVLFLANSGLGFGFYGQPYAATHVVTAVLAVLVVFVFLRVLGLI